jgi:hypothetical protein
MLGNTVCVSQLLSAVPVSTKSVGILSKEIPFFLKSPAATIPTW